MSAFYITCFDCSIIKAFLIFNSQGCVIVLWETIHTIFMLTHKIGNDLDKDQNKTFWINNKTVIFHFWSTSTLFCEGVSNYANSLQRVARWTENDQMKRALIHSEFRNLYWAFWHLNWINVHNSGEYCTNLKKLRMKYYMSFDNKYSFLYKWWLHEHYSQFQNLFHMQK